MFLAPSQPYAITMWDFSWLERRWPGAGYEDWDTALSELVERGYDAVRIDAYPHLVSKDPNREWEILPVWTQLDWGAPALTRVRILPELLQFMEAARRHKVKVGLSTWYRRDRDDVRLSIKTPEDQAKIWIDTLRHIKNANLMDTVLYVDFCNEFPIPKWTPYFYGGETGEELRRSSARVTDWMRKSIEIAKAAFPELDYTFSFCTQYDDWSDQDVNMLDFLEPHIWMAHRATSDYYQNIGGYTHQGFSPDGINMIVANGYDEYMRRQDYYDGKLLSEIDNIAQWSRASGKPLITTECWSLVDYKDWPLLDWGWIKDMCELGLTRAAESGRWVGMASSNFCGPQFVGMWRDVDWHQRMTKIIKEAPIDAELKSGQN